MMKHYITKRSKVDSIEGTFKCESYNGSIVWGKFIDLDGNERKRMLTLPEVAELMRSMDDKKGEKDEQLGRYKI